MAYTDTKIGSATFRVHVNQVSQSGNTSRVEVALDVLSPTAYNFYGVIYRTWHTGMAGSAASWAQWADNKIAWGASANWQRFWTYYITVAHDANGFGTAQARFKVESTGTSMGGPAYTNTTTLTLTRIPKVPATPKVAKTSANLTATNVQVDSSIPDNRGSGLTKYRFEWAKVASGSTFPSSYSWVENLGYRRDLSHTTKPTGQGAGLGNLTRGTRYLVRVMAANGVGYSARSAPAAFTTLHTRPDKPAKPSTSSVAATSVALKAANPAYVGAGVTSTRWELSTSSAFTTVSYVSTTTTATFTGLKRASTYYVRRRIANAIGTSDWSDTLTFTTAKTAPTAPRALVTTPTATSATVSWTAPADDGGAAITGYTVTLGSQTQKVTGRSATFTNLTANLDYAVTVTAANGVKDSQALTGTVRTLPGKATFEYKGSATALKLTFTWNAVAQGTAITARSATVKQGSTVVGTYAPGTYTLDVTPGTAYTIALAATTAAGESTATHTVTSLSGVPTKPALTARAAHPGGADLTCSTTANVPVTGWDVEIDGQVQRRDVTTLAATLSVRELVAGARVFRVRAVTAYGTSSWSDPATVQVQTVPTVPRSVTVTATKQVQVTFTAPASDGGALVDRYEVRIATDAAMQALVFEQTLQRVEAAIFTAPQSGTRYYADVRAINVHGPSAYSVPVNATTENFVTAVTTVGATTTAASSPYLEARWTTQAASQAVETSWAATVEAVTAVQVGGSNTSYAETEVGAPTNVHVVPVFRTSDAIDAHYPVPASSTGAITLDAAMTLVASTSDVTVPQLAAAASVTVGAVLDITPTDYLCDTYELVPIPVQYRSKGWI